MINPEVSIHYHSGGIYWTISSYDLITDRLKDVDRVLYLAKSMYMKSYFIHSMTRLRNISWI